MNILGIPLALIRFILLVISLIIVVGIGSILYYTKLAGPKLRFKIRTWWCKLALWIFGVKIIKTGELIHEDGALYISNHRSFIDPLIAFSTITHATVVSKAEVASYPLIGLGAKISGVIFVDRNNKESRNNTKDGIIKALQNNISILLFPEGTISTNKTTLDFRKGSFEAAELAAAPIIPFAMEYMNPSKDFWYIHNILMQYFVTFSSWRMEVRVHFFPKLTTLDAESSRTCAFDMINKKLMEFQQHWSTEDLIPNMK